jgi:ferredoxin-NADP reductase
VSGAVTFEFSSLSFTNPRSFHFVRPHQHATVADIFDRFPSVRLSFAEFFQIAPFNAPRYYTVSSSRQFVPDAVSITLGLRKTEALPLPRCSSYLAMLKPGDAVRASFYQSSFIFPFHDHRPIMLISAGTGIAPFRAFLQDLEHEDDTSPHQHRPAYLFYGCREPSVDFLYAEELQQAKTSGVLDQLHVAFSGDSARPKRVRELLRACCAHLKLTRVLSLVLAVRAGRVGRAERADSAASPPRRRLYLPVRQSGHGTRRQEGHRLGSAPTPGVLWRLDCDTRRGRARGDAEAGWAAYRDGALVALATMAARLIDRSSFRPVHARILRRSSRSRLFFAGEVAHQTQYSRQGLEVRSVTSPT